MREILERVFVLDPEERLTARDLCELLRVSDASIVGMKLQGMMLKEALNKAYGRIAALERERSIMSAEMDPSGRSLMLLSWPMSMLTSTMRKLAESRRLLHQR